MRSDLSRCVTGVALIALLILLSMASVSSLAIGWSAVAVVARFATSFVVGAAAAYAWVHRDAVVGITAAAAILVELLALAAWL